MCGGVGVLCVWFGDLYMCEGSICVSAGEGK